MSSILPDELEALERRLTNPDSHETRESLGALLAPGFREYGSSGRAFAAGEVLEGLLTAKRSAVRFEDFHVLPVSLSATLVTYRSRSEPGVGWKPPALRSSLWVSQGQSWQLLFHQGTRIDDDGKVEQG
jgi:hypothetical protein